MGTLSLLLNALYIACAFFAFGATSSDRPRVIVAIGDSTTAGAPFFVSPREYPPRGHGDEEASYPYWLRRKLSRWTVFNQGIDGQRSDQIRARFENDALAIRPQYVVILAGVNDSYQGIPVEKTKENLLWMYRRAAASGAVPIAASILPFDLATEIQNDRIDDINRWIADTSKKMDIPFCDLHEVTADPKNSWHLRGSPDGLHPDAATYRLMGEAVAKLIVKLERARQESGQERTSKK